MARTGPLARWFRQSQAARAVLSRLAAGYIALVEATTRWQVVGKDRADKVAADLDRGLISVFWHGRLFMSATYAPARQRRVYAMISQNHDGELIADIVGRFGVHGIRGSTYDRAKRRSKGGVPAFEAAHKALADESAIVGITPDGPRGPRMRAQPGAAQLAVVTGCPVLPIAFSVRRGWLLTNWDRFLVPTPFNRGAIVYGELMEPPTSSDPEDEARFLATVEHHLIEVTNRADALCGRDPVEPGPPLIAPV